jgi:hypothetical protein
MPFCSTLLQDVATWYNTVSQNCCEHLHWSTEILVRQMYTGTHFGKDTVVILQEKILAPT